MPPKIDNNREDQVSESDSDHNDAPTVVIDSSMEDIQNYRGEYIEEKGDDNINLNEPTSFNI